MLLRKSKKQDISSVILLQNALQDADAVVIGAGAGVSTSAGFTYSGERFAQYFHDFQEKYGIEDMYSGGFYPFPTREEFWAYWSRYILVNRYADPPGTAYRDLLRLVQDKDYFVLTTNVDHCFQKAGFDKKRLFYTQGDYGLFQCSEPCHDETYDNEQQIRQMVAKQNHMQIPANLLPCCPRCGKVMTMNLRADDRFVEDAGWHAAAERYEHFIDQHQTGKVLYWELGVGYNTPGIIKYPFWKFTWQNSHAVYACVNLEQAFAPEEIARQSICINGDIGEILQNLLYQQGI